LDRPQIDVEAFFLEEAFIVRNPHGRQIHWQCWAEDDELFV
jgi:hypothetical protein